MTHRHRWPGLLRAASLCVPLTAVSLLLAGCSATAASPDVAAPFDIGQGRQVYLECRGTGSPTVVLISGAGGAGDEWMQVLDSSGVPKPDAAAVFPSVATFTRVCTYDRPGTSRFDDRPVASTPIPQPSTVKANSEDLRAVLAAARESGPYVVVGASWGGLIAQFLTRAHPDDVHGLVLVDAASEFLEATLTPEQWTDWTQKAATAPAGMEAPDYPRSVAQISALPRAGQVRSVVLSSDQPWTLQVNGGSTWSAWLDAQRLLAQSLGAQLIADTHSGHPIANEQPRLVTDTIRRIVAQAR